MNEKQRIKEILKNPSQYLSGQFQKALGDEFISCSLNGSNIIIKCNYEIISDKTASNDLNLSLKDVIETIKSSTIQFNKITYVGFGNLIDKYGGESKEKVVELTYHSNTIKKINLDNFYSINLWTLADLRNLHPAVSKILK